MRGGGTEEEEEVEWWSCRKWTRVANNKRIKCVICEYYYLHNGENQAMHAIAIAIVFMFVFLYPYTDMCMCRSHIAVV